MNKIDSIVQIIKNNWDMSDIVYAWNRRCEEMGYSDDFIEYMHSFNDLFSGLSPLEIVETVRNCQFCTSDEYFAYNNYGNLVSFDDVEDYDSFSYEELAEYIVDGGDCGIEEVNTDQLLNEFIDEYFADYDSEAMFNLLSEYMEEETFDVLMDDWDVLADIAEDLRVEKEIK